MILLSQRDPRWAQKVLGISRLTVGRFGCTTTAISMLSDYFRCFQDPGQIASNVGNYTADGLINWANLSLGCFKFEKRLHFVDVFEIDKSLSDAAKAVILEVDHSHWVVVLSKSILGGYVIADPWFGDKSTTRRYKKITGSAHFIK